MKDGGVLLCTHAETCERLFLVHVSRVQRVCCGRGDEDEAEEEGVADDHDTSCWLRLSFPRDYAVTLRFGSADEAELCRSGIVHAVASWKEGDGGVPALPNDTMKLSDDADAQTDRLLAIQQRLMSTFEDAENELEAVAVVLAWLLDELDKTACPAEGSTVNLNEHMRIMHPMVIMKLSAVATDSGGLSLEECIAAASLLSGYAKLVDKIIMLYPRFGPLYNTDISQELSYLSKRYSEQTKPHFEDMADRLMQQSIRHAGQYNQQTDGVLTVDTNKDLALFAEQYIAEARKGSRLLLARCLDLIVTSLIGSYRAKLQAWVLAPLRSDKKTLHSSCQDPAFLLASANGAMALSDLVENLHDQYADLVEAFPLIEERIEQESRRCVLLAKTCVECVAGDLFISDVSEIGTRLASCSPTGQECDSAVATVLDYMGEFIGEHLDVGLKEAFVDEIFLRLVVLLLNCILSSGLAREPKRRVPVSLANTSSVWLRRDIAAVRELGLELAVESPGVTRVAPMLDWMESLVTAESNDDVAAACERVATDVLAYCAQTGGGGIGRDSETSSRLEVIAAGYAFISQSLLCRESHAAEAAFQCTQLQKIASLFGVRGAEVEKLEASIISGRVVEVGKGIGRALRMVCPLAAATLIRDERGPKKRLPTKKKTLHIKVRPHVQVYGGHMIVAGSTQPSAGSGNIFGGYAQTFSFVEHEGITGNKGQGDASEVGGGEKRAAAQVVASTTMTAQSMRGRKSSLDPAELEDELLDSNSLEERERPSSLDATKLEVELLGGLDDIDDFEVEEAEAGEARRGAKGGAVIARGKEDTSSGADAVPPQKSAPKPSSVGDAVPPQKSAPKPSSVGDAVPPQKPAPKPSSVGDAVPPQRSAPKPSSVGVAVPPQKPAPKPSSVGDAVPPQKPAPKPSSVGDAVPPQKPAPKPSSVGDAVPPQKPAPKPSSVGGPFRKADALPAKKAPAPSDTFSNGNDGPPMRKAPAPPCFKAPL
jgi:hypothetical protein